MLEDLAATRRGDKISQIVARRIVRDIVSNGLQPGATLPSETAMLGRLKVGRASLLEALRILEVHGLITIKSGPGGGPVVAAPTSGDFGRMSTLYFEMAGATFRELVEARLVLEPLMARMAAVKRDPEVVAALRGAVDISNAVPQSDGPTYGRTASEFHGLLSGASGNRILDLMARAMKDVFTTRVTGMIFPPENRARIRADHENVVKAIERGDATRAERLMRTHMEEFADQCEQRFPGLLDEVVDWR